MALLTFIGAIQHVTGSCYLIESHNGARVLLECGMHQGRRQQENRNRAAFPFNPATLDAVVISHAHVDHSGLLPKLVANGYQGPIYATPASCQLLELMLLDAAHLQERDAEWENRWRARQHKPAIKPLYTTPNAEQALKQRHPLPYGETLEIAKGIELTFHNAGHILGSAIVELVINDHQPGRRLVFSGDLGNTCSPLMQAPATLSEADVILMESTYGDRDHRDSEATLIELADILEQAHRDGGNVLIPSFSVGRTQDLLYYLGLFYQEGRLPQHAVFLDSPMAIRANSIYSHYPDQIDNGNRNLMKAKGVHQAKDWLPILRCTTALEDSMAINRVKHGAIIIAGSGMCNGGRIVHHLKHNLWRSDCHIVFPGFQTKGTLGRAIIDGASDVKIMHQRIVVKAQIHTLGGFSAHAGQSQLIDWVSHFTHRPDLYLIHGELEKMQTLQQTIQQKLDWTAHIPEPGEKIAI